MPNRNQLKISITTPTAGAAVPAGSLVVTGVASGKKTLNKVQVKVGTGSWVVASGTTSWTATVTIPVVTGSVTITAQVTDETGLNASATESVVVLAQDTTAPAITITTPASGATVTGKVAVTGTASDVGLGLSLVEVSVDSGAYAAASGTTSWSYMLDTSALTQASHTIHARATDEAGNRTVASVTVTVGAQHYPASYFTGPLGANNIVPADPSGAILILYHQGDGASGSANRTAVSARMSDCGRTFDGIGIHYGGTAGEVPGAGGGLYGSGSEAWVHSLGSIPVVTWAPGRGLSTSATQNTMISIINGDFDAEFTSAINYWKALDYRVMWRPFWEFDGNWFPWSPTANATANDGNANPGCTAAQWKTAWQHVAGLLNSLSASKVGLWWCPTEGYNRTLADSCYPGDAYVDWVGSDAYNQASSTVQTSPLHAGWAEFWELFNYTGHGTTAICKHDTYGPSKPFVVGETGCLYDSGTAARKANWYKNIDTASYGKLDMPYLCGIEMFDVDLHSSEGFDWRVDSNQTYAQKTAHTAGSVDATTYQGFKDFAAATRWNVGAAGGAT